jgi:hypothetical protein
LYLFGLLLGVTFLIATTGWTEPKPGTKAPIITHSFAVEKGIYGYIWKIYLEAEDPNGEMLKIASVVDQPGYGRYPTGWLYIKPEYRKHLKGYIQWNTFSSKTPFLYEWSNITLRVSIIDKAGNESNEVAFPFTFEITPIQYAYNLPAPFDQGNLPRLGHIMINLAQPDYGDLDHRMF